MMASPVLISAYLIVLAKATVIYNDYYPCIEETSVEICDRPLSSSGIFEDIPCTKTPTSAPTTALPTNAPTIDLSNGDSTSFSIPGDIVGGEVDCVEEYDRVVGQEFSSQFYDKQDKEIGGVVQFKDFDAGTCAVVIGGVECNECNRGCNSDTDVAYDCTNVPGGLLSTCGTAGQSSIVRSVYNPLLLRNETTVPTTTAPTAGDPTEAPTTSPTKESKTTALTTLLKNYTTVTSPPSKVPTTAPMEAPTEALNNHTTVAIKSPTTAPTKAPVKTTVPAPSSTAGTMAPATVSTTVSTTAPANASTKAPTKAPTTAPTTVPTKAPTKAPTTTPTKAPRTAPTTEHVASTTTSPETTSSDGPMLYRFVSIVVITLMMGTGALLS